MAYDDALAEAVRSDLRRYDGVTERAMFGGIAFMVGGNMAVGVTEDDLMVRVGRDAHDEALSLPGVSTMSMGERGMKGWVRVTADGMESDDALSEWVDRGVGFARSLPPK
jgi:TfoX/Sxy family transcriptional regulator of competence genes